MSTWARRKCVKCGAKARDHQDGFRANSPTRKTKPSDDKESDKEKGKATIKSDWSRLSALELKPAQLWYLRRTSWREPAAGPRQLASRWLEATARYARWWRLECDIKLPTTPE